MAEVPTASTEVFLKCHLEETHQAGLALFLFLSGSVISIKSRGLECLPS
jgi:hypothetical protein